MQHKTECEYLKLMNLPFDFPIETDRLVLRAPSRDDFDALFEYHSDAETCQYLPYEPRDRKALEESMVRRLSFTEFAPENNPLFFHVWTKETDELIGEFLLFSKSVEARQGEIGYVLNKRFQGQGYGLEAAKAVMELGFGAFNLHRIEAKCCAANVASWRLMEKLGMRREAHFIENAIFKGEWDELLIYAMLQREWRDLHP